MIYSRKEMLKNGKTCLLRNCESSDAEEILKLWEKTHTETDFLLAYPDEKSFSVSEEEKFLEERAKNKREVEICAVVDGRIVGLAGITAIGMKEKMRYRADFGISVMKDYWGMGVGRTLTEACVECAKKADYKQIELEVVADNVSAISLYKSAGFMEYGRNPRGFRSRYTGWQELILMRMELEK